MTYLIKAEDPSTLYEKYTSTLRLFGGKLQLTTNINEAKRVTREKDAKSRANLINNHWRKTNELFPEMHNLPEFFVYKHD